MPEHASGMRRLLVLLLVATSATLGSRAAYACSCVSSKPFLARVPDVELAFVGEVVRSLGRGRYEVRVDAVLKGRLPPRITMRAPQEASSCSIDVDPPEAVAYAGDGDLVIEQCRGVFLGDGAARLAAGGRTYPPDPDAPDPGASRAGVALLGLLAVAVAGTAWLRVRSRARWL